MVCQHNFRRAEISIFVDHDLVFRGPLTGAVRKRFGVLESVQGSFSKRLDVPAGQHELEVSLSAPAEGYKAVKSTVADLSRDSRKTLVINPRGGLQLAWQEDPSIAQEGTAGYRKYSSPALVTIWGSAVSATIGFFIQEFLRGRMRSRTLVSNSDQTTR